MFQILQWNILRLKKVILNYKFLKFCSRYPGLSTTDNVLEMLKLYLSKDPNSTIRANVSFSGGFGYCDNDLIIERFNKEMIHCDEGFIFDPITVRCYIIPNVLVNSSNYYEYCHEAYGAECLEFQNDDQVNSFMDLLISGK